MTGAATGTAPTRTRPSHRTGVATPAPPRRSATSASATSAPTTSTGSTSREDGIPEDRADHGRLLIQCPDRPGVVSAVSTFLAEAGANITSLDQFSTTAVGGTLFQRTGFHLAGLSVTRDELDRAFDTRVAQRRGMTHRLTEAARPKRAAIMVSKTDHCVLDLLWRHRRGPLDMNVVMVVSNHPDLADDVRPFGVPYIHVPATRDNRAEAESRILDLLRGNVDVVVPARYTQIITPAVDRHPARLRRHRLRPLHSADPGRPGIIARCAAFAFRKVSVEIWQQRLFGATCRHPLHAKPPGQRPGGFLFSRPVGTVCTITAP